MAVTLADVITYLRLVGVGNDSLYYEDINVAAGDMIQLAASAVAGQLDTSDQLEMFSLYQKVFIVNGAKLKVADFVNTKLTIEALDTAPTRGSIVTQATSNATMIVDFVNTAKTEIYGKTTSGTFVTTAGYTLSGGSMDPETRVPSAVDEASTLPHWYDWTVYAGDANTYGAMPTIAYLGCSYRGRTILAGDTNYPNQWYMSEQNNPFGFLYAVNIASSAVAGQNADAGQAGDIIRCLIPCHDDYLIFGASTSIYLLSGDPAQGGELLSLSDDTGIYGAKSWCMGPNGIIYFWGTNGLYRMEVPGRPVCISAINLPDLVTDSGANPATHRITMGYLSKGTGGIEICITKLSDGTNSNYWYDLKTEGFFPDAFPVQCGVYSILFYPSNTPSQCDLIFGCKDGYARIFSPTAKSDDIGPTDILIDSYVGFGPMQLSSNEHIDGTIKNLDIISAGGGTNGTQSDSDDIYCKVYSERTAEEIIEKLDSGADPKLSKTFVAPGKRKGNVDKRSVRGQYGAIVIGNSTLAKTWAFEKLIVDAEDTGRVI